MLKFSTPPAFLFIALCLGSISACAPPPAPATPTLSLSTATPSRTPTRTPVPSRTATITPIKTATATISPTFDLAPAATITPQPRAECPKVDPNVVLDSSSFDHLHDIYPEAGQESGTSYVDELPFEELREGFQQVSVAINDFLSQGGDWTKLQDLFDQQRTQLKPRFYGEVMRAEVTGDNHPEVFVWMALPLAEEGTMPYSPEADYYEAFFSVIIQETNLFVFTCKQDKFMIADTYAGSTLIPLPLAMPTTFDLNADGINEIILIQYSIASIGYGLSVKILSWDGNQFQELLPDWLNSDYHAPFADGPGINSGWARGRTGSFELLDIDNNGTTEVVISSGWFGGVCALLDRDVKLVLMWNGQDYTGFYWRTPPQYRIQAVWDGDEMTSYGFFEQALNFYEMAISDQTLLSWSPDYNDLDDPLCDNSPESDPIPENPQFDDEEPIRLAAYAFYRMMLIHIMTGDLAEAQRVYAQLTNEYQSTSGAIYVELASFVWNEYAVSGSIDEACNSANLFVEDNSEEVITIGRKTGIYPARLYSSGEVKPYSAMDFCPFGAE